MLQKFLFVGVGGSGGVTLRALRSLLGDYLVEHGYEDGIPAAWQFVHIDVPLEQDRRPERIPLLNDSDYVGLAVGGLPYREVDAMMCQHGQPVIRHTAGWRPHPNQVNVAPETGGGRFRAVGRVVFGARMAVAAQRLHGAMQALKGEATNIEFSRVCLRLTGNGRPKPDSAQVVVVASLAGGSGSGLVGDVCDLLRQIEPEVEARLMSILYTPEVFDDLPPADRAGINPNALAAMCELLNGRWNQEMPGPDEFALLKAAGAAGTGNVPRRGPRIPYLIGKSNGSITFANQGAVYEAVARGLAVLATGAEIQARFAAYEIGNWPDRATTRPDHSGLTGENYEVPLSSFGCASIGIGRDRFARYSVDRLARDATEHLLFGHWRRGEERERNEEEARLARVDVARAAFLAACRLEEKGPHRNHIIDSIRGGVTDTQARARMGGQLKAQLKDQVTEAWPHNAGTDLVGRRVIERMDVRWQTDFATYHAEYLRNAAGWANRVQAEIQRHAADLVANEGARVAFDVLHSAIGELTETVVPELRASLESQRRLVGELRTRVKAALASVSGAMPASHPRVDAAVDAALDSFHSATEELVHDLAIELIQDLCENLLAPLREAVGRGRDALQLEYLGTTMTPSPVPGWPETGNAVPPTVPQSYYPASNELVLDDIDRYPSIFADQIQAQVGHSFAGNAVAKARSEIITGIRENDLLTPTVIRAISRWVPRDGRLRQSDVASRAAFAVDIELNALRERARRWIRQPDTPMSRYLEQTLESYLGDRRGTGEEQAARLEMFRGKLAHAVSLSRPLVDLDPPALSRIHGGQQAGYREVMTPLPFPDGHPGRDAVAKVFAGLQPAQFAQLFGDKPQQRIDIFTFLDGPVQPMVMSSFTYPIRAQWARDRVKPALAGFWTWRRARQLPWFVPCTPEIRRDMVRGWLVARLLGQVRSAGADLLRSPVEIWTPDAGFQSFPHPLLGRPLQQPDELLPAVLESLALTIIGEPFTPYARLKHLGQSVLAGYDQARCELVRWVQDGALAAGAPVPDRELAAVAGEKASAVRQQHAGEMLDRYQLQAERHASLDLNAVDSLEVSRAWELREDILDAVDKVRSAVDGAHVQDGIAW